jgi:hypothetical protein
MKRTQVLLLALAAVFASASAEVFFEETFDGTSTRISREKHRSHSDTVSRLFPRNAAFLDLVTRAAFDGHVLTTRASITARIAQIRGPTAG